MTTANPSTKREKARERERFQQSVKFPVISPEQWIIIQESSTCRTIHDDRMAPPASRQYIAGALDKKQRLSFPSPRACICRQGIPFRNHAHVESSPPLKRPVIIHCVPRLCFRSPLKTENSPKRTLFPHRCTFETRVIFAPSLPPSRNHRSPGKH